MTRYDDFEPCEGDEYVVHAVSKMTLPKEMTSEERLEAIIEWVYSLEKLPAEVKMEFEAKVRTAFKLNPEQFENCTDLSFAIVEEADDGEG